MINSQTLCCDEMKTKTPKIEKKYTQKESAHTQETIWNKSSECSATVWSTCRISTEEKRHSITNAQRSNSSESKQQQQKRKKKKTTQSMEGNNIFYGFYHTFHCTGQRFCLCVARMFIVCTFSVSITHYFICSIKRRDNEKVPFSISSPLRGHSARAVRPCARMPV